MTLYEILQNSSPMQRNPQAFINKLAEQTNRSKHEIKAEFNKLVSEGKVLAYQDGMYYKVEVVERKAPRSSTPDIQPAPPIAYKIYNYFKESCVGLGYAKNMKDIATWFGISDRELRDIIYRINFRGYKLKNGVTFTRKIMGDSNGYYLVANDGEYKEFRNKRVRKLLNAVKELKITDEDFNLDNQAKLPLSEWERELVKSVSDDLGGNQ